MAEDTNYLCKTTRTFLYFWSMIINLFICLFIYIFIYFWKMLKVTKGFTNSYTGYSNHAFLFFSIFPRLGQNNIPKQMSISLLVQQAWPRCMRLSTRETKTSYPVDMTELLLQGHTETHASDCRFCLQWRDVRKIGPVVGWRQIFPGPFVGSAQLWESAPFVGLTLFVSLTNILLKIC